MKLALYTLSCLLISIVIVATLFVVTIAALIDGLIRMVNQSLDGFSDISEWMVTHEGRIVRKDTVLFEEDYYNKA